MIYDDVKPIRPIYLVETDKSVYHIPASTCLIDSELKIICFYDKGSVQAMFCVEDVKAFEEVGAL